MKKILSTLVLLTGMLMMSTTVIAEPLTVKGDDDIESVLKAHNGKRVTVKLNSGDELTGTAGPVNDNLIQLRELSGKEFFDAIINIDEISALIIRTKE